jgi:hypothetical protein
MRGASALHAGGEQRGFLIRTTTFSINGCRLSGVPLGVAGRLPLGSALSGEEWDGRLRRVTSARRKKAPPVGSCHTRRRLTQTSQGSKLYRLDGLNVPFSSELRPTDTGTRAGEAPPGAVGGDGDCTFGASPATQSSVSEVSWYFGTKLPMSREQSIPEHVVVERVQTGVRMEKRLLKVLKAFADFHDLSLGDLLEGIVLHAFDGKQPFNDENLARIAELKNVFGLDLSAGNSHRLKEQRRGRR